jgi:O-antigen/teichoic acid export membrane protein
MIDKIRKNTLWLLTSQGISIIVSLFLTLILAKHLGPRYNGIYNYANSIVGIFAIFVDFGMSTVLIRDIARDTNLAKKYLDNIVSLKIFIGIIILLLITITSLFVKHYTDITLIMLFLGLYNILNGFYILFAGIFRSHNKMVYESINTTISKILMLILGIIALYYYKSLLDYSLAFFITSLISVIIAVFIIKKRFTNFSFSINKDFWKYMLKEIWPYGLSSIVVTVYFTIDQVILGSIKPITQVGYYALARSATGVVTSIIGILIGVLFPSLSLLFKKDLSAFSDLVNNSIKFMIILAVIFVVEMILNSKGYVLLIFGYKYYGSILPLQLLSITTGLIFVNALIGNIFGAIDRQKELLLGLAISMVINIVLNFSLIPYFNAPGAAFASILTELFIGIYSYTILKRSYEIRLLKFLKVPVLAGIIAGFIMFYFKNLNIILISFVGLIVYFVMLVILKEISIQFIKESIGLGRKGENT